MYYNKIKTIEFILLLTLFSMNTWAGAYHYRADVKGMVCAFCVYSVGKKIRKLPGVDANSVNVSLKNNVVTFSATHKISEHKLTSLFSQSGFSINNLTVSKIATNNNIIKIAKEARLDLNIDVFETDQFTWVLQAIGDIADKTPSRLIIEAPPEQEETILKALLMGRKHLIQVIFIPLDSIDTVHLQLFNVLDSADTVYLQLFNVAESVS